MRKREREKAHEHGLLPLSSTVFVVTTKIFILFVRFNEFTCLFFFTPSLSIRLQRVGLSRTQFVYSTPESQTRHPVSCSFCAAFERICVQNAIVWSHSMLVLSRPREIEKSTVNTLLAHFMHLMRLYYANRRNFKKNTLK